MSQETTTAIVQNAYGDTHDVIEYLGVHNNKRCFGLINKDELVTYDEPFYVLVDGTKLEMVRMPMIADDAYKDSQFATIERKFKFFEDHKMFE